jgi:hypothetical protein
MVEDRRLDLGRHPVGVRAAGARQTVEQPLGAKVITISAHNGETIAKRDSRIWRRSLSFSRRCAIGETGPALVGMHPSQQGFVQASSRKIDLQIQP